MIYLLRHGETVWNREGRNQGQLDSPLTRTGIAQVEAMGRTLRAEIPDVRRWAIIASPLGRAWQSAAIVAGVLGLDPSEIEHEPRLMEFSFGDWQGRTFDEIDAAEPGAVARRKDDLWHFRPPGGESYADLSARVAPWVSTLKDWAKLIVVCHGGTGRAVRGRYAGLTPAQVLALSHRQDELYRLNDGGFEVLETGYGDGETGATL